MIDRYSWEASFALEPSRTSAARGETFYVVGCLFRSDACLVQILFALNERYFLNEKGSIKAVDTVPRRPPRFGETVSAVLAQSGSDAAQLCTRVRQIEDAVSVVRAVCGRVPAEEPPL